MAGQIAHGVMLGLMKTCIKLKVSLFRYLGARPHIPNTTIIPLLPDLVRQAKAMA